MTNDRISNLLAGLAAVALWFGCCGQAIAVEDWPNLARYRPANAALKPPTAAPRIVFLGDSITDFWIQKSPAFFAQGDFVDRGISGQTTPQMLIRFQQDVVALQPAAVLILAGINDIAGNTGPSSNSMIEDNITSMVDISKAHGIKPVLCSLLPTSKPETKDRIRDLNSWLARYAAETNIGFIDYFSAMADRDGTMPAALSDDGLHPNVEGYEIMQPLALAAIARIYDPRR